MRFLIDAQLSPRLAEYLRGLGHEAEHVALCLGERTPDRQVADYAVTTSAVLVSKDADFVELVERRGVPSLLWVRTGNSSHHLLVARLKSQWTRLLAELDAGKLIIELI